LYCVVLCCSVFSVLQCVAVCCSVLQCDVSPQGHARGPQTGVGALFRSELQRVAVCQRVLQYVAVVCGSVLPLLKVTNVVWGGSN